MLVVEIVPDGKEARDYSLLYSEMIMERATNAHVNEKLTNICYGVSDLSVVLKCVLR